MRDANGLETMEGMKYIASVPKDEVIISTAVKDGVLYLAADKHLYKLVDDKRLEHADWNDVGPLEW